MTGGLSWRKGGEKRRRSEHLKGKSRVTFNKKFSSGKFLEKIKQSYIHAPNSKGSRIHGIPKSSLGGGGGEILIFFFIEKKKTLVI